MSGKQFSAILDKAPIINGQKEWFFATRANHRTSGPRRKCRTCAERTPSWLFRHKHAMKEQPYVRYDSSSSDESPSTAALQYQVAVERCRREKELEGNIAPLEAKILGEGVDPPSPPSLLPKKESLTLSDGKVRRKGYGLSY